MARPIKPNSFKVIGDIVEIYMSHGFKTIVSLSDYDRVKKFRWFLNSGKNYAYTASNRKHIWLHRFVNNTPDGMPTDHINNNGLDNRRDNLRTATRSQNSTNWKRKQSSGLRGAYSVHANNRSKKRFFSTIYISGKRKFIGTYKTALEAAEAYDEAAIKYHGEFAVLNFPRSNYEEKL